MLSRRVPRATSNFAATTRTEAMLGVAVVDVPAATVDDVVDPFASVVEVVEEEVVEEELVEAPAFAVTSSDVKADTIAPEVLKSPIAKSRTPFAASEPPVIAVGVRRTYKPPPRSTAPVIVLGFTPKCPFV